MLASIVCAVSCAQAETADGQNCEANTTKSSTMEGKKILVAYFSRAGQNYAVGNVEKGNTCVLAEIIADATGGTLFEIAPVNNYPADYDECTRVAKSEKESGARPAIKADIPVEDYDVIYLGYPNWWADMPMAVYTFIEKHNWQGKTVVPFCTHEGSGLSRTETYVAQACKGATVGKGLAVKGQTAQNKREQTRQTVLNWLKAQ